MDQRLRLLERAAMAGDEEAKTLLKHAQCRSFGHDWKTRDVCISTFPINYKTINESCKRCGYVENPIDSKPTNPANRASAIERLLHRYAYGSMQELQQEYQKILEEQSD